MDLSKIDRRTWLLIGLGLILLLNLDVGGSTTAPIKQPGLRVAVIYETSTKTTPAVVAIRDSGRTRKLLEDRCVKEDGGACFRFLDADIPLSNAPQWVADALAVKRDSLPWLVVSNGRTGHSGPLPATVDEFVAIVEKHAK